MPNITVGRYDNPVVIDGVEYPKGHDYAGWIEPEDKTWIAFVGDDHHVEMYLDRDETGGILDRDPGSGEIIPNVSVPEDETGEGEVGV